MKELPERMLTGHTKNYGRRLEVACHNNAGLFSYSFFWV